MDKAEIVILEGGEEYEPKPSDPIHCDLHNITVRWEDLDPIQRLAVQENLDINGDRCILSPAEGS